MSETPAHLLIVEDNRDTRMLLRYMLQEQLTVDLVADVEEALDIAERRTYDLVLIDINLGEKRTGIDLLHLLRDKPAYQEVPILALTAYALPNDRERFLEEGFDDYIGKPFTRESLMDPIRKALADPPS